MSIATSDLAEKILSKNIDKREAMRSFEGLSENERSELIAKLQIKLTDTSAKDKTADQLKAVDQRDLREIHRDFISQLTTDYCGFVSTSKQNSLKYQNHFVDQRRPFHLIRDIKDLHFQITYEKAEGAYIYDVDGNKYIDLAGDLGVNLFGHKPDFIVDALKESLDKGIPLIGYSESIFDAAKLFCEITGHERSLFTQSGTEAVMWAVRIARAATRKQKIVIFDGAYHGLSDAVVAVKDDAGISYSAGPGMLQEFADQLIVLDYGDMNQLDIIERECDDIAGVLVEPVQSRHPYNQPVAFLKELRKLTLEKNIPLIFDEMITGFRVSTKGAQGYFGIKADIATYGKIPGGGLPTGVIAGSAKYMDLIDGGTWHFDDDSMPKQKRTLMAGTHSQNPMKIAAVIATLSEIQRRSEESKKEGRTGCFLSVLNNKTRSMSSEINSYFKENRIPVVVDHFGSLFRFRFEDSYWGITEALFFILLRMRGVETNIQGNCFLTLAHSDEDIKAIVEAVKDSAKTLVAAEFFEERKEEAGVPPQELHKPVEGHNNELSSEAEVVSTKEIEKDIEFNEQDKSENNFAAIDPNSQQIEQLKEMIKSDLQKFQSGGL